MDVILSSNLCRFDQEFPAGVLPLLEGSSIFFSSCLKIVFGFSSFLIMFVGVSFFVIILVGVCVASLNQGLTLSPQIQTLVITSSTSVASASFSFLFLGLQVHVCYAVSRGSLTWESS